MKTEEIALSRVVENEENPRTITTEKFQKLVKSLLVFPRMLTLRPIVIDETMKVLGGNMRLRALKHIVSMDWDTLRFTVSKGERFTKGEVDALLKYWEGWRKKPVVTIVNATDLTEAQKSEFIIKDNVSFGAWDYNILANAFDADLLESWGMTSAELFDKASFFKKDKTSNSNGEDVEKIIVEIPQCFAENKTEMIAAIKDRLISYKVKVY